MFGAHRGGGGQQSPARRPSGDGRAGSSTAGAARRGHWRRRGPRRATGSARWRRRGPHRARSRRWPPRQAGRRRAALDVDDAQLTAPKGRLVMCPGKGARYGEVPLAADARGILEAWLTERDKRRGSGAGPAQWLSREGRRLSERSVQLVIARVAVRRTRRAGSGRRTGDPCPDSRRPRRGHRRRGCRPPGRRSPPLGGRSRQPRRLPARGQALDALLRPIDQLTPQPA